MTRFRLGSYTAIAVGFIALTVPHVVFGAANPIVPQLGSTCYCPGSAPDYGCILQVLQNVINAAVELGIILCVIWIAYAGFSLMLSGGNPEARSKGKTRIANAVIGIAVILCSWIIVDFIMKTIYEPNRIFEGNNFGPWNTILAPTPGDECIKQRDPNALASGTVPIFFGSPGGSSVNGVSGGGVCLVRNSGPCATTNFISAFGSGASNASQICSAESANGLLLRGDKTTEGNPVSFGLFQINITAHKVAGLNCPIAFDSVFTGSHHNVRIINPALYVQCRDAALNPSNNASVAASIYKGDHNSWKQWSTHVKCGLAYTELQKLAFLNIKPTTCYE